MEALFALSFGTLSRVAIRLIAVGGLFLLAGCATFSRDLERAHDHYDRSEFPAALALLRVLADDKDVLSPREQVEFTYLRGMTDYRLAEASSPGPTRDAFRANATEYLRLTTSLDKGRPDALNQSQKDRLTTTLAVLEGRAVDDPPSSVDAAE